MIKRFLNLLSKPPINSIIAWSGIVVAFCGFALKDFVFVVTEFPVAHWVVYAIGAIGIIIGLPTALINSWKHQSA